MAEILTFSQLSAQDIRFGRGVFEVLLGDGRAATLNEHNLDDFDGIFHTEDATVNDATQVLNLRHTTTGTPAAGIGTRLLFQTESADENPANVGAIEFNFDDVTAGSEDSTAYLYLRRAGAILSSAYGFRNTGNFQVLFTAALTAARTITIPDATDTLVNLGSAQTLTSKTLTNPVVNAGGGSDTFIPGGVINVDTTDGATGANTTETDLITYTFPATSLSTNGDYVKVKAFGITGANANTKTMRLYFGTTVIASNDITTAPNNGDWVLEGTVVRTGSNTQESTAHGIVGSTQQTHSHSAHTETDSSSITIKVTGENAVATASDITAKGLVIEFENAS